MREQGELDHGRLHGVAANIEFGIDEGNAELRQCIGYQLRSFATERMPISAPKRERSVPSSSSTRLSPLSPF
jgi:hypothetical protein